MDLPPNGTGGSERFAGRHLLERTLLLDLEVSRRGDILKLGAVLGNTTLVRPKAAPFAAVAAELECLASRAQALLGHNVTGYDLPILRERTPTTALLKLPVIDTLVLSPICFPENPYHHLVKDYKLVTESVNDPVADARQAGRLFLDEFQSLSGMLANEPRLVELLHYLLATPDGPPNLEAGRLAQGLDLVFRAAGSRMPEQAGALERCRELFARYACASVPVTPALVQSAEQRLALAYVVTWLRVAGSNSVLPPWVRLQHPLTVKLIRSLRDVPCASADCVYCRTVHDPERQLKRFFGWDSFRPTPASKSGGSLQREIVEAGMRDQSLLAILPTGAGKSLCFQLPALARNVRRGVLTLVISPLQALMKDQVDGLVRRTGTPFAAALYGLLTPLERGDVLRRVAMGDIAILYVSPEQLRNRSFRKAIEQREIGCWVFDEAHCLSKWGHDFRPDYLYAGRFIREFAEKHGSEIPPIACFTATAKQDVKDEIIDFFRKETARELALFEGGVERDNLRFEVQAVPAPAKLERVHDLLASRLNAASGGSAIVFRSTREASVVTAEYLIEKGWRAEAFHAGLAAPEKKRIQDAFLAGAINVICATNAFGMGIDKEDVRLVIHADMPGSLENYLQEAGRAGRDGKAANCILLYEEADCEQQFRLGARSRLSRRDIAQILRSLRKAARGGREEVVLTTGEILRDDDIETGIRLEDRDADNRVRTAVAWLERAGFVQRNENATQVFQARPLVKDLGEASRMMAGLRLSQQEQGLWLAILREVMNSGPSEHLSVDRLSLLPEFVRYASDGKAGNPEYVSAKVLRVLASMADAGLMKRDTLLNAFLRYKVAGHSRERLEKLVQLERRMLDLLATEDPDAEGWLNLSLRMLNQRLAGENFPSSVEVLGALLKSLSWDGRGFAGMKGSLELRPVARDSCRLRLNRTWTQILELAEKRWRVASLIVEALWAKVPPETPASAELLVPFSFEELEAAVQQDLLLRSDLKLASATAALERALMFLHEQHVIVLQQGLAIFRPAMTLRLLPEAKGEKYASSHFAPLEHHYNQRTVQVHVMGEYARRGLEEIQEALKLVLAYFSLGMEAFVRRYFRTKLDLLQHATTAQSFHRIITSLADRAQTKIVTADKGTNILILAGPGSGKTRTVVHRCAYLLRVERVRPESVLVCCFNHCAAVELRRRLNDLAGADAKGVTVVTYHGLAMRLLGYSFAAPAEKEIDFDAIIKDAVKLLRGEVVPTGMEPDELRDRLLAGLQYILVDEYQDIDEPQYEMISALAGRTLSDPDAKLSILAVGDDDQNIYSFRGANVRFIRQFRQDYEAEVHYLIENYRSTGHIIDAANRLIAANLDRMKTDHSIRVNQSRQVLPLGGEFAERDPHTRGKVQIIRVQDEAGESAAAVAEVCRFNRLGVEWPDIAVLSRTHQALARVRSLAEAQNVPVRWVAQRDKMPRLTQVREIHQFLGFVNDNRRTCKRASELRQILLSQCAHEPASPWLQFLLRLLADWEIESSDAETPLDNAIEFICEACAEARREFSWGDGVTLSTIHSAKGTEFGHVVLVGAWSGAANPATAEENRRVYYVGMTRAKHTLALVDRHPLPAELSGPPFLVRLFEQPIPSAPALNYDTLSLEDLNLGYPSCFAPQHPIHQHLAQLRPGDKLAMRLTSSGRAELVDSSGLCVARLSRKAEAEWKPRLGAISEIRILAIIRRSQEQGAEEARVQDCRVPVWEIPMVEIISRSAPEWA